MRPVRCAAAEDQATTPGAKIHGLQLARWPCADFVEKSNMNKNAQEIMTSGQVFNFGQVSGEFDVEEEQQEAPLCSPRLSFCDISDKKAPIHYAGLLNEELARGYGDRWAALRPPR